MSKKDFAIEWEDGESEENDPAVVKVFEMLLQNNRDGPEED